MLHLSEELQVQQHEMQQEAEPPPRMLPLSEQLQVEQHEIQ